MTGIRLGFDMPLEELVFFLVVPICGLLTYEAVGQLLSRRRRRAEHRAGRSRCLSTRCSRPVGIAAVVLLELLLLRTGIFRTAAVLVRDGDRLRVPGAGGRLAHEALRSDRDLRPRNCLGIRWPWDIPVEDFGFGFAMVTLAILLWRRWLDAADNEQQLGRRRTERMAVITTEIVPTVSTWCRRVRPAGVAQSRLPPAPALGGRRVVEPLPRAGAPRGSSISAAVPVPPPGPCLAGGAGRPVQILGIDASAGMLAQAGAKVWPPGVRFVVGMAEDARCRPRGIWGLERPRSGLFAAYLFRNVADRDELLTEVCDLLAAGGALVVQDYSVAGSRRARLVWTLVCWLVVIPLSRPWSGDPALPLPVAQRARLRRRPDASPTGWPAPASSTSRSARSPAGSAASCTPSGPAGRDPTGHRRRSGAVLAARVAISGRFAIRLRPGRRPTGSTDPVVVVGGGIAGLAAATGLAERGVPVDPGGAGGPARRPGASLAGPAGGGTGR